MRTSHKHTQLPAWLSSGWVRLLLTILCLGGLAIVLVVRSGRSIAKANRDELEVARVELEQAQADFRANPTKESGALLQAALKIYRAALGVIPAGPSQSTPTPVEL